jgi:hypothetical protein
MNLSFRQSQGSVSPNGSGLSLRAQRASLSIWPIARRVSKAPDEPAQSQGSVSPNSSGVSHQAQRVSLHGLSQGEFPKPRMSLTVPGRVSPNSSRVSLQAQRVSLYGTPR